jgi:hypothetical protein
MDEKEDLKNQLKGMSNYIDWFHRFKQECYLNDWLLQTGDYSADIVKIKAIKKHMMKTISNQAIGYFDASKSIQENMTVLSNSFGQGYTNANDQIEIVKSNIWFNPKKNPMRVFTWLNKQIRIIAAAGGSVTDDMKPDIIIKGLDSEKDVGQFWFTCKGQMKMEKGRENGIVSSAAKAEEFVVKFWRAHVTPQILLTEGQVGPS